MARRRSSRSLAPRRPVGVEWLEPRQVLATMVAVGSEISATSQPFIKLVDAETGAVVAQTLAFEAAFRGGVQAVMGPMDNSGAPPKIYAFSGPGRIAEVRVFEQIVSGSTTTLSELTAYRTQLFGPNYRFGATGTVGPVDAHGLALLVNFVLSDVLLPLAKAVLNVGVPLPSLGGLSLWGTSIQYAPGFAGLCTNFSYAPPPQSAVAAGL